MTSISWNWNSLLSGQGKVLQKVRDLWLSTYSFDQSMDNIKPNFLSTGNDQRKQTGLVRADSGFFSPSPITPYRADFSMQAGFRVAATEMTAVVSESGGSPKVSGRPPLARHRSLTEVSSHDSKLPRTKLIWHELIHWHQVLYIIGCSEVMATCVDTVTRIIILCHDYYLFTEWFKCVDLCYNLLRGINIYIYNNL